MHLDAHKVLPRTSSTKHRFNILDFVTVVGSLIAIEYPSVNAFKLIRVGRPLRLINQSTSQKVIVKALLSMIPKIVHVVMFALVIGIALAVLAVNFFQGRVQQCIDPVKVVAMPFDQVDCKLPLVWSNPPWVGNFDNVLSALLVMFELSTMENWPVTMVTFVDATPPGLRPQRDFNPGAAVFFIICIVVLAYILKDLFVSSMLGTYDTDRAQITGKAHESEEATEWMKLYRGMVQLAPNLTAKPPRREWLPPSMMTVTKWAYNVTVHQHFKTLSFTIVLLNALCYVVNYYQQAYQQTQFVRICNIFFTCWFLVEVLLKWAAMGLYHFFKSGDSREVIWNRIDFIVVIVSWVELGLQFNVLNQEDFQPSVFTLVRSFKLLAILHMHPDMNRIIRTLIFALPATLSILGLMCIAFFCYAVVGVLMFSKLNLAITKGMDKHAHFQDVGTAMLLLFRCMTGA